MNFSIIILVKNYKNLVFNHLRNHPKISSKLFLFIFAIFYQSTFSQFTYTGTNGTYTESFDNAFTYVDKTPINTGILYDRVQSFADLDILREDGNITKTYYEHFIQSWSELYRASYNPTFQSVETIQNSLRNNNSNLIPIGILNTKMNYIDYGLPYQPSLNYSNNYFYNIQGINPFLEKQVTIISPLIEKIHSNSAIFILQCNFGNSKNRIGCRRWIRL